jgi:hypothetical protein
MSATRDEKIDLLNAAEQLWIEVEEVVNHHRRRFAKARRLSGFLKWTTVGAAALTALSTIPSASAEADAVATVVHWSWITIVLSVGTASTAALDQAFSPAKTMESLWKSITSLKSVQSDLQSFALDLSRTEQISNPMAIVKALRDKAEEVFGAIHYEVTKEDKGAAKQAAEDTTLHKILQRIQSVDKGAEAIHEEDDRPIAAAADADEMIEVTRRKV